MESYEDILYVERPLSRRQRMENTKRAKQFAPFAALKGFEECVKEKEVVYIERPVLAEEQKESIDRMMQTMTCGIEIQIEYYEECRYLQGKGRKKIQKGTVEAWKPEAYIQVNGVRIEVVDILEISVGSCMITC